MKSLRKAHLATEKRVILLPKTSMTLGFLIKLEKWKCFCFFPCFTENS